MIAVLDTQKSLLAALDRLMGEADDVWFCVAWASGAGAMAAHWRSTELSKVSRALVGLDFDHTEPASLRAFASVPGRLRVVTDPQGTFHPKLILGFTGDRVLAIMGSSNFTSGGFGGNTELNIFVDKRATSSTARDLKAYFKRHWKRPESFEPSSEFLDEYEARYVARRNQPKPPRVRATGGRRRPPRLGDILSAEWADFVRMILGQEGQTSTNGGAIEVTTPNGYLAEALAVRAAWRHAGSFASIPTDERQLLAGFGPLSTGYFGDMSVSPPFTGAVGSNPQGSRSRG